MARVRYFVSPEKPTLPLKSRNFLISCVHGLPETAMFAWGFGNPGHGMRRSKTPSEADASRADELFRSRLDSLIDLRHPLAQLAGRIPRRARRRAVGDAAARAGRRWSSGPADAADGGLAQSKACERTVRRRRVLALTGKPVVTTVRHRGGVFPDAAAV